jgi:FtsH-binding integral membrane protein
MLQRKQSIYLFLGMAFTLLLLISPFEFLQTLNHEEINALPPVFEDGIYNVYDHVLFVVFASAAALFSLLALLLFRNRKTQILLAQFAVILNVGLLVFSLVVFYQSIVGMAELLIWQPHIGWAMPVLSGICVIYAIKLIQKDEKLVKSMDRLR